MNMKAVLIGLVAVLTGCSKTPNAPTAEKLADAQQTARSDGKAETPAPKCPAKVDPALTGPDIIGLKLGMARDAALNFVRCHNAQAELEFADNWLQLELRGQELGTQVFTATQGTLRVCDASDYLCRRRSQKWGEIAEQVTVAAPGLPGRETVMGIWRTQGFARGQAPTVEATVTALIKKYGEPQERSSGREDGMRLNWIRDAQDVPLVANDQRLGNCTNVSADGGGPHAWSAACGMTVTAFIDYDDENPALAQRLLVGLLDQQRLYKYQEAMQAAIDAADTARRGKEVEQAEKAGNNLGL